MRKGQITIFVILALVILIIAGLTYYFVYKAKTTQVIPERSSVPENLKALQSFIEGCIEQVGQEGIIKLGAHGGYIDPYDEYLSGRSFIKNPYIQSESDLAYVSADNPDTSVAYWYYSFTEGNCINCQMMSQAPFIDEMERQLSLYISENIGQCLNNFTAFKAQGFIMNYSEDVLVRTTIREKDVLLEGVLPINVTGTKVQGNMDKYIATVDIPLMQYYLMALNITATEFDTGFFENMNAYLVYSYSGLSTTMLPPLYATSGDYSITYWTQTGVKENFKSLLSSYIPLMQVPGTRNYKARPTIGVSLYEKNFYNFLDLKFFDKTYPSTDISFYYPDQDIYIQIRPADGELLGPREDKTGSISLLPSKQQNTYQFFYDFSYPVIVEIHDDYKPNQSYTFLFALEPTVKENLKLKDWWNESKRPLYFEEGFFTRVYNDPLKGQNVTDQNGASTPYKQRPTNTLLCDITQRTSGDVSMRIYDAATQKSLDGVGVGFGCGTLAICPIGQAQFNATTKTTAFTTTLPNCMNGFMVFDKPGYLTKKIPITTQAGKKINLGLVGLEPIIEKNVSIKKFVIQNPSVQTSYGLVYLGKYFNITPQNISPTDTVIITLTRTTPEPLDTLWTQTVVVGQNVSDKPNTLYLAPGEYAIKAQLIDHKGFIIHKECDEVCVEEYPIIGCVKYKRYPEQDINMIPAPWGGLDFNASNSVAIPLADLLSNSTLELSVIRLANPRCINDMKDLGELGAISNQYRSILLPRFIN